MNRTTLSCFVLLAMPPFADASWLSPGAWSISVDGNAHGPPGSDSFTQTEDVASALGSRTVIGKAESVGGEVNGFPDGTQSFASAEATVAASSIAFNSQMNFDHGTALGFSSDAAARAQFSFEVTQAVMTRFSLTAGGAHRVVGATLRDAADAKLWDVFVPESVIGINWNDALVPAEFPFSRNWSLTPGRYSLTLVHSTVPLVGTGGPSEFEFRLDSELAGDLDSDGELDADDIDLLTMAISDPQMADEFDLNSDGTIDQNDKSFWVHELANTYFGDANLDGEFNSTDLIDVFRAAQFEDEIAMNSSWVTGDWNGNAEFDSGDLVVAFQDGGFELGPRSPSPVPDPATFSILTAGFVGILIRHRMSVSG